MVVRNQHGKPQFLRQSDLLYSGDSVVTGQDGIDAVISRGADDGFIDSITILNPVRNFIIHIGPDSCKRPVKQIGRAYTVYVVISNNADSFSLRCLSLQNLHRQIHIL